MKQYKVKEIFGPTIQGEGSHAGRAVLFLRFAGCNRWSGREEDRHKSICSFCDTDFLGGKMMTKEQIGEALAHLNGPESPSPGHLWAVVISGGEPLLQLDLELASYLRDRGFVLHVETNGSIEPTWPLRSYVEHVTMSPKQPAFETRLRTCDDLKILWPPIGPEITPKKFDHNDYNARNRFIQPVVPSNGDPFEYKKNLDNAVAEVLRLGSRWRLGLQLHKTLGVK